MLTKHLTAFYINEPTGQTSSRCELMGKLHVRVGRKKQPIFVRLSPAGSAVRSRLGTYAWHHTRILIQVVGTNKYVILCVHDVRERLRRLFKQIGRIIIVIITCIIITIVIGTRSPPRVRFVRRRRPAKDTRISYQRARGSWPVSMSSIVRPRVFTQGRAMTMITITTIAVIATTII